MKKIIFAFIFIMMNQFVFSQSEAMRFLSMGFNACSRIEGEINYYFYGYDDYSEALIFSTHIRLSTGEPGGFFPNGLIEYGFGSYKYRRYNGQNNSIGYEHIVPTIGDYGEEHKFENGKLVYWALTADGRRPYTVLEKIEQNAQAITIYAKNGDRSIRERYYNISRTKLLDIFLEKYVELIYKVNEMVNEDNDNKEYIMPLLQGRTSRELTIFRNCLYAIKGYKFANSTWTEFFNKYLNGYNGRYTNDEVTSMFTNNEKWLLDLIIQYENKR
jgi:hypothetical protein